MFLRNTKAENIQKLTFLYFVFNNCKNHENAFRFSRHFYEVDQ